MRTALDDDEDGATIPSADTVVRLLRAVQRLRDELKTAAPDKLRASVRSYVAHHLFGPAGLDSPDAGSDDGKRRMTAALEAIARPGPEDGSTEEAPPSILADDFLPALEGTLIEMLSPASATAFGPLVLFSAHGCRDLVSE